MESEKVYNPFESMTFTDDRCFLCGEKLDDENTSVEHVFHNGYNTILICGIRDLYFLIGLRYLIGALQYHVVRNVIMTF